MTVADIHSIDRNHAERAKKHDWALVRCCAELCLEYVQDPRQLLGRIRRRYSVRYCVDLGGLTLS